MSVRAYLKYRKTAVSWLCEYPSHWELKPFWSLFRRVKRVGYDTKTVLSAYRDHGVIPKSSRVDNNNKTSDDLNAYQLVRVSDLVINKMKAWQGSVAVSTHEGIVSPAYFVYTPIHKEDTKFLHYLFRSNSYIQAYHAMSKGIRPFQWDLDPDQHNQMPVLLPPYAEQAAIAAFLDHETGRIDALVAEQERLIALLKEKRQAVISHAVTRGLNPDAPMKDSRVEWLGKVPAHWKIAPLKQVAAVERGRSTHRPRNDPALYNGLYPFIQTGYISSAPSNGVIVDYAQTLNNYGLRFSRLFPKGTLVMGIAASIAKVATLGFDACFPDSVVSIAPWSDDLLQSYLQWALRSAEKQMIDLAVESTQLNLNIDRIGGLLIMLPPTDEQACIADHLSRHSVDIDDLSTNAERAIALLRERRAALISAAVTGQIDVRDAAPAAQAVA